MFISPDSSVLRKKGCSPDIRPVCCCFSSFDGSTTTGIVAESGGVFEAFWATAGWQNHPLAIRARAANRHVT